MLLHSNMGHRSEDGRREVYYPSQIQTWLRKCMSGWAKPLKQMAIFSMRFPTGQSMRQKAVSSEEVNIHLSLAGIISNIGAPFPTWHSARVHTDTRVAIAIPMC